jgi:putative ABC transport system permease protein
MAFAHALNNRPMLRSYIVIAVRALMNNPVFTVINIGGFAIGLAACMLMFLWIGDEMSYDTFHKNYDRIYKVYRTEDDGQGAILTRESVSLPTLAGSLEKSHLIEYAAQTTRGEHFMLQNGEERINKIGLMVTEDFFKIFTFQTVRGNLDKALLDPNSIVLTESTAKALFADVDPINQIVRIENRDDLKVIAVIQDLPQQSIFHFDFVSPFSYLEKTYPDIRQFRDDWDTTTPRMYFLLKDGANSEEVSMAIRDLIKEHSKTKPPSMDELFIEPVKNWRLKMTFEEGKKAQAGQIVYVQLFSAIAVLVLSIACFNFMNLSTAQNIRRAQEVGIRKCLGSSRHRLIFQFLFESTLQVAIAFVFALALLVLVLPLFNLLVDKQITVNLSDPWLIMGSIAFVVAIGIVSGSYPSFFLSSFVPARVLKGKAGTDRGAVSLRRVLVVTQFGLSIAITIATLIVYQQILHVQSRDLGFEPHSIVQITMNENANKNFDSIEKELLRSGGATVVSKGTEFIANIVSYTNVSWQGCEKPPIFLYAGTGYNNIRTMGATLLAGRDFSREFNDSSSVVISETAASIIGAQNIIGHKLKFNEKWYTIVGVFKDIIVKSPLQSPDPLIFFLVRESSQMVVRLNDSMPVQTALGRVKQVWSRLNPEWPADFSFVGEDFDKKLSRITLMGRLATLFSILAIIITALGLFGLAAFTLQRRTRELGIRKVFGATSLSLVTMISKDFAKLNVIGFLFAAPLTWWFMDDLLQAYAYRVDVAWWLFAAVGLTMLVLALSIVGLQALKASRTNPAISLKQE